MNQVLLLVSFILSAEPTAEQSELLRVFRSEFVEITPGQGKFPAQFHMGRDDGPANERPQHEVRFKYSFFVAKYEVPQNLWVAVMKNNPSKWQGKRNSVEMLTFHEAKDFCRKATTMMQQLKLIGSDQEVRLPTEAEWEYVARGGTTTTYSFGDDLTALGEYGWFNGNAAGNDPPVGAKRPNPWGLYDIHGYLREWCTDEKHDNYANAPQDGSAWTNSENSSSGVVRGGSWKDPAGGLTSTFRLFLPRDLRDDAVGLRCVLANAPK